MSARIAGSRARCRQASAYEGGTAPTIARMSRSVASRRDLPYDVARDDPACTACRTGGGVFRRPRSARRSRLTWFALSLAAALTQAAQFAVVKGRARAIPPLVIVAGTQTVALTVWLGFFLVSGHPFTPPRHEEEAQPHGERHRVAGLLPRVGAPVHTAAVGVAGHRRVEHPGDGDERVPR